MHMDMHIRKAADMIPWESDGLCHYGCVVFILMSQFTLTWKPTWFTFR